MKVYSCFSAVPRVSRLVNLVYGLLAHRHREERLALCRRLLVVANVAATLPEGQGVRVEPAQRRCCCSRCGDTRLLYRGLPTEVTLLEGVVPADSS